MSFKEQGYVVVEKAIHAEVCKLLACQFRMLRDTSLYMSGLDPKKDKLALGDDQVTHSFSSYAFLGFESLMLLLQPQVEEHTGKQVFPAYTYARIYYKGATMKEHVDRPSCQLSITACIDHDKKHKWPIGFQRRDGKRIEVYTEPGDIVIYSGCELAHWRDAYQGKEQIQAFMHYVDAKGKYKDYKFDKRPMLGLTDEFKP